MHARSISFRIHWVLVSRSLVAVIQFDRLESYGGLAVHENEREREPVPAPLGSSLRS